VKHFDSDLVADVQTFGAINGSHPALTQAFKEFVLGIEDTSD
jgi:hypothetical protein